MVLNSHQSHSWEGLVENSLTFSISSINLMVSSKEKKGFRELNVKSETAKNRNCFDWNPFEKTIQISTSPLHYL